jgi:hypothetical protein
MAPDMQAIAWSLFFTALQNRIQKKGSESKDGRLSIADIRHAVGRASIDVTDNKILQTEANVIAQTLVPFLAFINEQPTESPLGSAMPKGEEQLP